MDVAKDTDLSKGPGAKTAVTIEQNARIEALFAKVDTLRGIGPRLAEMLSRLLTPKGDRQARCLDLLMHLPYGVIDYELKTDGSALTEGDRATVDLTVLAHRPPFRKRHPYRVRCALGDEDLELVFFRGRQRYLEDQLPINQRRVVSGIVTRYGKAWQMVHPDLITTTDVLSETRWLQPVYPSVQGLHQKTLTRTLYSALEGLPELPEWQDPEWLRTQNWPSVTAALMRLHRPAEPVDLEGSSPARQRLAYDELLATQLSLSLSRGLAPAEEVGRSLRASHQQRRMMIESLPFHLTAAQEKAVIDIDTDLGKPERMLRLLQGDVGSGKTVVAALAMLHAIEAGTQAALMAPTEVLTRQHAASIADLLEATGVVTALLTGRERGPARRLLLERLRAGEVQALIGTHALFQDDVEFADLGLVVIDEQHRFGVDQRINLAKKGPKSDVLVMTATPIPRTLVLSFYGDIAISELREKPAGRKPIATRALPQSKLDDVVKAIGRSLERGEQVFWVCPLVNSSEELDMTSAEDRFESLHQQFGTKVGLVHGQMPASEKDEQMAAFVSGKTRLLVATTVIEVGVDVPGATVMVIEHAERFGLAQLHQLRGRVGRGDRPSSCLLLFAEPLGNLARSRLDVMRQTEDGFQIAEEDLRLRGPGEILGTRQSGLPSFQLADLSIHADLLAAARDDAKLVLSRDPDLKSPRGQALRLLLRWFEGDGAKDYLRSG
ncbi:MAG: ATP-dependent DNA helicase RecG [Geminicoccaceae bacterium]